MIFYTSFTKAINSLGHLLLERGHSIEVKSWQSKDVSNDPKSFMWELLDTSFRVFVTGDEPEWIKGIKPNLPWANAHFKERVGGIPLNPPPSNEFWPFAQAGNSEFKKQYKFDHTYPERFWPKYTREQANHVMRGIRFEYGDLLSVINLLERDPNTRQAYLPIFFPEDTGSMHNQRVPCTLGYLFVHRAGVLHITYYMRSCDYLRHFRDDIYLAVKLLNFVAKELSYKPALGAYNMHIANLHCFVADKTIIEKRIKV